MLPGRHRYIIPANWKLLAENFGGDMYHFNSTHASLLMLGRAGQADRIRTSGNDIEGVRVSQLGVRRRRPSAARCAAAFLRRRAGRRTTGGRQRASLPKRSRGCRSARLAADGCSASGSRRPTAIHTGTIWPNLSFNGLGTAIYARTFVQWQPRGPEETDVWQWAFVERSAPREVKEAMAFTLTQRQAAAGMVAPDDVDNFQRMRDVLHTAKAGKLEFNYDLGGEETTS